MNERVAASKPIGHPARVRILRILIEVPVMLSLVAFANRTKGWFPA